MNQNQLFEAKAAGRPRRVRPTSVVAIASAACLGAVLLAAPAQAATVNAVAPWGDTLASGQALLSASSTELCATYNFIGARGTTNPAGPTSIDGGITYGQLPTPAVRDDGSLTYGATDIDGLNGKIDGIVANFLNAVALKNTSSSTGITETVRADAVAYPASLSIAEGDIVYVTSVMTGADLMRKQVEKVAAECPTSKIILIGFSQGAQVVGNVLSKYSPWPLSAAVKDRISAVVLEGDPTYMQGMPYNKSVNSPKSGIFPIRQKDALTWLGTRIASYCLSGDMFCQSTLSLTGTKLSLKPNSAFFTRPTSFIIHGNYALPENQKIASDFVIGQVLKP